MHRGIDVWRYGNDMNGRRLEDWMIGRKVVSFGHMFYRF